MYNFALLALIFFSVILSAQTAHSILRYFSGTTVVDGQARLSWVIFGGSTCNDIIIERSTNRTIYEAIADITGICGLPDTDIPYVFSHYSKISLDFH